MGNKNLKYIQDNLQGSQFSITAIFPRGPAQKKKHNTFERH